MLKVKEFLGKIKNGDYTYTPSEIVNAIKETNTKIINIGMSDGTNFIVSKLDENIKSNTFMEIIDVFVNGIYYRKKVVINTSFISYITIE